VAMQALAKDSAKRYPSANDMLLGLTRALPSAMRESTDEEVAEFIRRLVPDRVERQKQAIKQALEAADRREMSKSAPHLNAPPEVGDEPATVLEGIGREMTPSADGRSLPGASSTEPPPSFARSERTRIRNLLLLAGAGILAAGLGLGFLFGGGIVQSGGAAAVSPVPPPGVEPTPTAMTPPITASPMPSGMPPEALPEEPASSASAAPASAPRPAGGKRSAGKTQPTPSGKKGPFVSPIRNPGF